MEGRRPVPLRRAPRHRRHGARPRRCSRRWGSTPSSRSSAATRAPAWSSRSGPGVTQRRRSATTCRRSFVPSCGRCRYCSTGRQNLCDLGAGTFGGGMITDGTAPPPRRRQDRSRCSPSSARSPSTPCVAGELGHQGRRRPAARRRGARVVRRGHRLGLGRQPRPTSGPATPSSSSASAASASTPCRAPRWPAPRASSPSTRSSSSGRRRWSSAPPTRSPRWRRPCPTVTELTWGQMADKVIMTPGVMYGDLMALATDADRQGRHDASSPPWRR